MRVSRQQAAENRQRIVETASRLFRDRGFDGIGVDAIMKDDGFGSTGNTLLFTVGFFVAVLVANSYGVTLRELKLAVSWGLGGAFMLISALALLKAGLARW